MKDNQPLSLQEIQKVSLDILKFVAKICEDNSIQYYLMYGTLIGAIRHKGYIPWDDDVDIMMPRPDYIKFLQYAKTHKEEFGHYEIFNRETNKNYIYGITRVSDSRYKIIEEGRTNYGIGIFIDIYPYDGLGNESTEALLTLKKTRKYCDKIVGIIHPQQQKKHYKNIKEFYSSIYHKIKNKILGVNYYYKKLDKLSTKYSYDESTFVGPVIWFFSQPQKVLFRRSLFGNNYKHIFVDREFNIPIYYDNLLTQEYGDYMTLPPEEKRTGHHDYKAYKK